MFKRFIFAALLSALVLCHKPYAIEIPEDFKYKGKPINSKCLNFIGDGSRFDPRNLNKCGGKLPQNRNSHFGPDFIGYKDKDGIAYSYYKYLGKVGNLHVILSKVGGGGSGQFSGIYGVERKGDIIQLKKEWAVGDRCNGAVKDASIIDGRIQSSSYATYADLPDVVKNNSIPKELKESLSYCAVCCVAIVHSDEDIVKGITLLDEEIEIAEENANNCLKNKLLAKAQKKGPKNLDLTIEELKAVIDDFAKTCKAPAKNTALN